MQQSRVDVADALIADTAGMRVLMVRGVRGWGLPGDKREAGETPAQAAERETLEEAGLRVRRRARG